MRAVPHYGQTTDFTCGPSSVIMAMKALKPSVKADRALELKLWREANTIFMSPSGGHGGFGAEVHVNHRGVLLGDRAESKERAEAMRMPQERDLKAARAAGIPVSYDGLDIEGLAAALRGGALSTAPSRSLTDRSASATPGSCRRPR